jgi:hypothetical protein
VAVALAGVRLADRQAGAALPAGLSAPLTYASATDRFTTQAASYTMRDADVQDAMAAADATAARFANSLMGTPCLQGMGAGTIEACVEPIVRSRGELLFRRPLTDDEVRRYVAMVTALPAGTSRQTALTLVLRALLVAPQFLYRIEIGEPDPRAPGRSTLTPFETATALAFSLTDAPPDQPLWDAAHAGTLRDSTVLATHAARLLGSPASNELLRRFLAEYLRFAGAAALNKPAPPKPRQHRPELLVRETELFVDEILARAARKDFLSLLLTSTMAFASRDTAATYGSNTTAATAERVTLRDSDRIGILGQPSWLVAHSQVDHNDPIKRGRFIRESLLCGSVPLANIDNLPQIPNDPSRTLRERLVAHTANPTCQACHRLMDPIGLGLEGFDHYGAARATEAGRPVDTTGALIGTGDQDGDFRGLRELATRLASSQAVSRCFIAHASQFFLGRALEPQDGCALAAMHAVYMTSGGDLVAALQTLFTSDAFRARTPSQP